MSEVENRDAARIVLLDPQDRILLQEILASDFAGSVWIMPGGGLAGGETHTAAALRELREEVGHVADLGPCVWIREHEFTFRGIRYMQRERFFLARTEPFAVDASQMGELESEVVLGHRWWSVDEIESAVGTLFAPRLLGRYLRQLLEGDLPTEPIDVGI